MEGLSTEVSFAQRLAGNTKKIRDRALKKLRNYLKSKSASKKGGFSKEDLLKLWKGLHYCLWMQDKAIVQEDLNVTLSQLVHNLATVESQLLFIQTFFITEAREWNSIDVWRLDKFMMLIRNVLAESLMVLKKQKWQKDHLQQLMAVFHEEVMSPTSQIIPDGLKIHFADIYLQEVEKIGANQLTGEQLVQLMEPFIQYVRAAKNTEVVKRVITRIFHPVIARAVDLLKKRQLESSGEEQEEDIPLQDLKFDNSLLAERLFEVSKQPDMLGRNRPLIYRLVQKLQDLDKGVLPREREVVIGQGVTEKDIVEAAQQLAKFDTPKKKKKKRKHTAENNTEEEDSDNEGKENDSSDQNNNDGSIAVYIAPQTGGSAGGVVSGKQKRKLSIETDPATVIPAKKMKRKSMDSGSESKPFDRLKKLLKSKKDSTRRVSDAISTQVTPKSVPTKHAAVGSGWTVTPIKDADKTDGNQISASADCAGSKTKMPPQIVIHSTIHVNGQKRTHPDSSGNTSGFKTETIVTSKQESTLKLEQEVQQPSTPIFKQVITPPDTPVWTDTIGEGEVEIFVPSKKYKGKLDVTPTKGFATFDQSLAPSAYVKKSVVKTPRSTVGAKYVKSSGCASNKRVSFDMKKNKAQAFKESLQSPMTPFNPYKKPDQGILKTPEPSRTPVTTQSEPRPRSIGLRVTATPTSTISTKPIRKATPMKKRPKAKDFFYL